MRYDFEKLKKEFMNLKTMDEWNILRKKDPDMKVSAMDHEMKQHMNLLIRTTATPEQLENPRTHYDYRKK